MNQVIPPANIENELERIWDSLQGTNKMRACLFNLIIYTKKNRREEYLHEVAQKLIQKFPSRIIFITVDEESKEQKLETSVSVMTADEGECAIVCDLINIESSMSYHERIPFVILPHILPDLPVYLVYADDPTVEDPITYKLEKFATRIIFDSEASDNLPLFAQTVLKHREVSACDIADLNWARIEGWRELFAGTFHSPEELKQLRGAKAIHIHYNAEKTAASCHTQVPAIYLQGWLASQLDWKLEGVKREKDLLCFSYGNVQVQLHPEKLSEVRPGRIISVEIETEEERIFKFHRDPKCPEHVTIEVSTKERCSLPIHSLFEKDTSGQSLVKEICHKGTSKHYLKLIEMLSTIKEGLICE